MKNEIALQLLLVVGSIFGIGAVWTALAWSREKAAERRVWTAYRVEAGILAAIFVPAYLGGPLVLLVASLLHVLCVREFYAALSLAGPPPIVRLGEALGVGGLVLVYFVPGVTPFLVVGVLAVALVLAFAGRSTTGPRSAAGWAARLAQTLWGVVYPGLCLAFWVELSALPGGFGAVVFAYSLVEISDSFAYLLGVAIGRHPIFPRLSPKKTWEGTLGGAAATVLAGFVLRFAVPDFTTLQVVGATLLLVAAGQAGDLFASSIKRRARIKDFSDRIPTQGGVLDVYDSLLFALPLFYYFLRVNAAP